MTWQQIVNPDGSLGKQYANDDSQVYSLQGMDRSGCNFPRQWLVLDNQV